MQIDYTVFRDNLLSLLSAYRITKQELAEAIDVRVTTIYRYLSEDRTPELINIAKIAQYFNISMERLLGLSEPTQGEPSVEERELLNQFRRASEDDRRIINMILSKYRE